MVSSNDFNKLRYTHRDYESIKQDLINAIPSMTQKWTCTEESDPGIVLIKLMAMLGDSLSYNMDKSILELFLDTVTQRKNCDKILATLGYKMHWYRSARVQAEARYVTSTSGSTYIVTPFMQFSTGSLNYAYVGEQQEVSGYSNATLELVEGNVRTATFNENSLQDNRYYFSQKEKIDETIFDLVIDDGSVSCKLVENLYLVTDNSQVYFEFNVDEFDTPYIELVEGWRESLGNSSDPHQFSLKYLVSSGSEGNVPADAFLYKSNESGYLYLSNESNFEYTSSSPFNAPGKDYETPNQARKNSANYLRTFDTLVTPTDFEKGVRQIPMISASRCIDQQTINIDSLDFDTINLRRNDDTPIAAEDIPSEDIDTTKDPDELKPYVAMLYLIKDDFESNDCADAGVSPYTYFSDINNQIHNDEDYFFTYRPNQEVQNKVDADLEDYTVLPVKIDYGTTKVYPFYIVGEIILDNDNLPPSEIEKIYDKINQNLVEYFKPYNRSYGQKPSVVEISSIILDSDPRVRYYNPGASAIEWIDNTVESFIDSTCFCYCLGLKEVEGN